MPVRLDTQLKLLFPPHVLYQRGYGQRDHLFYAIFGEIVHGSDMDAKQTEATEGHFVQLLEAWILLERFVVRFGEGDNYL